MCAARWRDRTHAGVHSALPWCRCSASTCSTGTSTCALARFECCSCWGAWRRRGRGRACSWQRTRTRQEKGVQSWQPRMQRTFSYMQSCCRPCFAAHSCTAHLCPVLSALRPCSCICWRAWSRQRAGSRWTQGRSGWSQVPTKTITSNRSVLGWGCWQCSRKGCGTRLVSHVRRSGVLRRPASRALFLQPSRPHPQPAIDLRRRRLGSCACATPAAGTTTSAW